jgi:hypothetical protein
MRIALENLEYRAPARQAIRITQARAILRHRHAQLVAIAASPRARALQRWLAVFAFVLLYLLVCAWIQNAELRDDKRAGTRAIAESEARVAYLEAEIAEAAATRDSPMFYVIEAGTPREARDKLQRLGLLIAKRHYELGEATPALVMP